MKALKYLLGILLFLLVAFLLVGVFKPTIEYTNSVEVNKPVPESFAVMMDESKMDQWLEGYKDSKTLEGNPNEVGSKYEITVEQEGEIFVMTELVTAYDKNERYAFLLDNEVLQSDMDIRFSAKGDNKTLISSTTEMRGKNMIYRSLFVLVKGSMVKQDMENLARLKQVIESNTTDYFPVELEAEAMGNDTTNNEQ